MKTGRERGWGSSVVDEDGLFAGRDVGKRQGLLRGCQRGWQALHVFLGLELDARERVASGLGLHDAKGIAVYEEQVVDVAVALLQLELADRNAVARREVHVLAVLNEPARLRQQGVNLLAGLGFRRVLAASW